MKTAISLIIFTVFIYSNSFTQGTRGSISGILKDSTGAVKDLANVYLENSSFGTTSDASGKFKLSNIPSGKYTLVISLIGYQTQIRKVKIEAAKETTLEIILKENLHTLSAVVVSGDGPKTENQKIEEQPIVVDVIDLKNNQVKSTTLTQLLNLSTGIKVRQSSGVGSETNINLNGMQGKSIRMFRDGIPLDYLGKAFDISLIPTSNLDRVEIYKGVLPAEMGSDALGGALNLVSKKQQNNSLDLSYSFGSFNTHEVALSSYSLIKKNAFISTQSYYVSSDNNYWIDAKVIDNETKNYKNVHVRRFHDGVQSLYLSTKFGLLPNKILDKAEVEIGFLSHNTDLQHDLYMTRAFGEAGFTQKLFQANSFLEKRISKDIKVNLFNAYSRTEDAFTDTTRNRYNWLGEVYTVSSNRGELNNNATLQQIQYDRLLGRMMVVLFENGNHSIIYSHNYNYLSRIGDNPLGQKIINTDIDPLTIKSTYFKNVFSLGLKSNFFNGRLNNVFTIKNYSIKTSGVDIQYSYTAEPKSSKENINGIANSIKYNISSRSFARISYERSARIPDAEEYFGNGLTVSGNLNLASERSNNLNLGYAGYFHYPTKNKFDVNLFVRDQENLILLIPWLPFGQYSNWAKARSIGAEISNSGKIIKKLNYLVNITYQDIRRTGISNPAEELLLDSRLPNIPFFFGNISLNYSIDSLFKRSGKLNIYTTYGMTEHYYLQAIPKSMQSSNVFGKAKINSDLIIPTQHVLDLGITYTLPKLPLNINLEANNLLDNKLYDRFKVQRPGRNFKIKISYHLK